MARVFDWKHSFISDQNKMARPATQVIGFAPKGILFKDTRSKR